MPNGNRQNIVSELIGRGQEALQAERAHVLFTGLQEAWFGSAKHFKEGNRGVYGEVIVS